MNSPFPPVPASPLLLNYLLGLVFVVHLIFMNFVVAAPLVILWNLITGGAQKRFISEWLAAVLPAAFTFTITFGVSSLLFVQVLYPERFFTANILLGRIWLAVIGLLMLAFYCTYLMRSFLRRHERGTIPTGLFTLVATALVWSVAAIMVGNYFASATRADWPVLITNPFRVLDNLTFSPRFLHYIFGAFAVLGFWMIWISWWRSKRGARSEEVTAFRRQGLMLTLGATGAEVIVGVLFLIWLPSNVWDKLFSGTFPGLVWISGVATSLVILGLLIVANVYPDRIIWQRTTTILMLWTTVGMVAGRDIVRILAFGNDFSIDRLPTALQTGPMLVFFLLLLLGLCLLLALVWLVWKLPPQQD
ncbi:hypothetical protein EHM69_08525 [candidate division KSB1 bacterium]|nr:MAG: hypothetical protein EHM69_08525 [candidate division KSB1 bacterium]